MGGKQTLGFNYETGTLEHLPTFVINLRCAMFRQILTVGGEAGALAASFPIKAEAKTRPGEFDTSTQPESGY